MKYHLEFDVELQKNSYGGRYIVVEGIDGSGKSTQIERLKKHLESKGNEVITTREPRKEIGLIADINKKILEGALKVPRNAFQYLFTADRIMHMEELVVPALKENKVVISDRCFWSAIPYGAMDSSKLFDEKIAESLLVSQGVLAHHYKVIVPDITLYFELPVEVAIQRMGSMNKTNELYEEKNTLEQVILGYKWLMKKFPNEFAVVDADAPLEEVTSNMVQVIERNL